MRWNRVSTILPSALLLLASVALSLVVCRWIAETFFFDKFYYQKSVDHGYAPEGEPFVWERFGNRARDTIELRNGIEACKREPTSCRAFETDDGEDPFTIALIGDSFVWGQGLKERDRFAVTLERELDASRPTRIVALAAMGDSLLDNYIKYHWIEKLADRVDLAVFALMDNDLLMTDERRYDAELFHRVADACRGKPLYYDPPYQTDPDPTLPYSEHVKASFDAERYANPCILEELVSHYLPVDRAVYLFFTGAWGEAASLEKYIAPFRRRGLRVLETGVHIERHYRDRPQEAFRVSRKDSHPSRLANRVFTELLVAEISRDPSFLAR